MRRVLHIALFLLLALSCGPRKIPREKMENIMADMLVLDQQIKLNKELRYEAEHSLVYEGVFESYGYDTDDFLYSMEHYLHRPETMEKMLESVGERLEGEAKLAQQEINLERWREGYLRIYYEKTDTTRLPRLARSPLDSLCISFKDGDVKLVLPPEKEESL